MPRPLALPTLAVALAAVSMACSGDGPTSPPPDTFPFPQERDTAYLDGNRVSMPMTNDGRIGQNATGVDAGRFPNGRDRYLFGAGFLVAAPGGGNPLAAVGYWPSSGSSTFNTPPESLPIRAGYPVLSAPAEPGLEAFATFQPVADEEIRVLLAQGPSGQLTGPRDGDELPVLAFQRGFAFDEPALRDGVFFRLDLQLYQGGPVEGVKAGFETDPDIGNQYVDDARAWVQVGDDQVVVSWDTDLFEEGFQSRPALLLQAVYSHEGAPTFSREHLKHSIRFLSPGAVLELLEGRLSPGRRGLVDIGRPVNDDIHALVATTVPDLGRDTAVGVGAALFFVPVPDAVVPADLARDPVTGALVAPAGVLAAVRDAALAFRDAYRIRIQTLPPLDLEDFPSSTSNPD